MSILQKSSAFALRHVGRNIVDGTYIEDEFQWYRRLYTRFLNHYLDSFLRGGVTIDALRSVGLIGDRADDWLHENPGFHCERGGCCIPHAEMKRLYIEVISETI